MSPLLPPRELPPEPIVLPVPGQNQAARHRAEARPGGRGRARSHPSAGIAEDLAMTDGLAVGGQQGAERRDTRGISKFLFSDKVTTFPFSLKLIGAEILIT